MNLKTLLVIAALATAVASPSVAFAESDIHPANNERGYTVHPDHFKSTKTREQVLAELDAARADGSLRYLQRGLPVPDRNPGMGRSREEVAREAASMTFQDRRQMNIQTGRGR